MDRSRTVTVVVIAAVAITTYALVGRSHPPSETFKADNIVATTSIQLNSAPATTLVEFDGSKKLTGYAGSGCGPGSAIGALSTSGGATCVATGGGATPSVSIPAPTFFNGTIPLDTLGTIDWIECGVGSPGNSAMLYSTSSTGTQMASKLSGGWLWRTWAPVGHNASYTGNSDPATTFTASAADSQLQVALSSHASCGAFGAGGNSGWGIVLRVPANTSQRVLRWYLNGQNCDLTVTATLSLSGTTASQTVSATTNHLFTITYTGGVSGEDLVVQAMTSNAVGACVFNAYAAALGVS